MQHLSQEQLDSIIIDGALPTEAETHLASCEVCSRSLAQAKTQITDLKSFAFAHYERVMQPPSSGKVLTFQPQPTARKLFTLSPQFAIAATLLLAFGLGVWIVSQNTVQAPTNEIAKRAGSVTVASNTIPSSNSDDADDLLLQRIASARSRSMPQALHPASLIIAERNRTRTSSSSAAQEN